MGQTAKDATKEKTFTDLVLSYPPDSTQNLQHTQIQSLCRNKGENNNIGCSIIEEKHESKRLIKRKQDKLLKG